jgi:hypothetical protein
MGLDSSDRSDWCAPSRWYHRGVKQVLGPASLLAQISTLRFPPAPLHAGQFREVFNRLSQVGTFNYQVTGDGVELATPPQESGHALKVSIGRDAVTVAFDPTGKSAEFAAEELLVILKEVAAVLPIPVFVHQTHVLRKIFPLAAGGDARAFLMESVIPVPPGRLAGWKRGFAAVGVRFIFPPQQMTDLSAHDLRIESFLPDPAKIFAEDTATFLVPLPAGSWDQLKANLAEAHRFLDEHAAALLRGSAAPDA